MSVSTFGTVLLTIFSISSIFLNAEMVRKLNSFSTPFVYAFCGDVLAVLESFSVMVAVFSTSLSM